MSDWIPVTERLPEESQSVLISQGSYVDSAYFNKAEKTFRIYGDSILVHAWMPLPQPYQPSPEKP